MDTSNGLFWTFSVTHGIWRAEPLPMSDSLILVPWLRIKDTYSYNSLDKTLWACGFHGMITLASSQKDYVKCIVSILQLELWGLIAINQEYYFWHFEFLWHIITNCILHIAYAYYPSPSKRCPSVSSRRQLIALLLKFPLSTCQLMPCKSSLASKSGVFQFLF